MKVYNYQAAPGGAPVFIEVALQPNGTISAFKLHHVAPSGPDVDVTNRFHEVFTLSPGTLPAVAVLYLRPLTIAASATMAMRVVQGGTVAPDPAGGTHVVGGDDLSGTLVDATTGESQPIPQAGGVTTIGPLTPGAQAELIVTAR